MTFLKNTAMTFGLIGAVSLTAMPAMAQGQGGMTQQPQTQMQQSVDYTDTQLEAYADAAREVSMIHAKMAPKIKAADGEQQRQQMFGQMQKQMMGAVKDAEGISVEEYNSISQAARQDKELADRIVAMLQPAQGESSAQ